MNKSNKKVNQANKKGLFITFEGTDGAGKTTVLKKVVAKLQKEYGGLIVETKEPGGSDNKIAQEIRKVILDNKNENMCPKTELLLYEAARSQNLNDLIIPKLKEGKIVICDRYDDSTIVYQGKLRGINIKDVKNINKFATSNLVPNLTVLLTVDEENSKKRVMNRTKKINRLDSESLRNKSFFSLINNAYDQIAKQHSKRVKKVDANLSINDVFNESYNLVKEKIENWLKEKNKNK